MPRPRPRAGRRGIVRGGAAAAAALLIGAGSLLPASALGEDGTFDLPLESSTVPLLPDAVTSIPLVALLEDADQDELDLSTATLAVPPSLGKADSSAMAVSEDGRSLVVSGEGTWSLLGADLMFTPESGGGAPTLPVGLSIASSHGTRSQVAEITPKDLSVATIDEHSAAGTDVTVPLGLDVPADGSVRMTLDGLTSGSSLTADGSRLIIPDQGGWQLSADGTSVTYAPGGARLGYQPTPVRVVAQDGEGAPVAAAEVDLTVPIISDLPWSAPYGQEIRFSVSEGQQYVDLSTLRLAPPEGVEGVQLSSDGTRAVVPGQGTWSLDREAGAVRFHPESADVHVTAPMEVTGTDDQGNDASPGLLSTAYPILQDREQAATPGTPVVFDLSTGTRDVAPDSLRIDADALPDGASVASDGLSAEVPGAGSWTLDLDALTLTFTPADEGAELESAVHLTGTGIYADNTAEGSFTARIVGAVPVLRDDVERTAPGTPRTIDVLANDTAGSAAAPLVTSSVRLRSLDATNLQDLEDFTGTRLVIPGEATYTVQANGAITVTPDPEFTGTTTAVEYTVEDADGVPQTASLSVDVEAGAGADPGSRTEASGINSLLVGLMPASRSTSVVFGTIVLLLLFGGGVSLAIGLRMERDRRDWSD